jgi:nitroreductase
MLAAISLGFAAKVVSGKRVQSCALRGLFKLGEDERLIGFVAIGTSMKRERQMPRKSPEQVITIL